MLICNLNGKGYKESLPTSLRNQIITYFQNSIIIGLVLFGSLPLPLPPIKTVGTRPKYTEKITITGLPRRISNKMNMVA